MKKIIFLLLTVCLCLPAAVMADNTDKKQQNVLKKSVKNV